MEKQSDGNYRDRIPEVKVLKNRDFGEKVAKVWTSMTGSGLLSAEGEEERIEANVQSQQLINSLGLGANTVSELVEVLRDPQKTKRQQELANENLQALGLGVFLVMRDGGDETLSDRLGMGSVEMIEEILPDSLKGLGVVVRNNIIDNTQICSLLDSHDRVRAKWRLFATDQSKRQEYERLGMALAELDDSIPEGHPDRPQLEMVVAYVTYELENLIDPQLALQQKELEIQAEQAELRGEINKMSLEELLHAFMEITPPRERSPQPWDYNPPDWMNLPNGRGMEVNEWRRILSLAETFFGGVYRKRNDTQGFNVSPEAVGQLIMNMPQLPKGDFEFLYNHPVLNLREVSREIMRDLLEPAVYTREYYDTNQGEMRPQEIIIYRFKEKRNNDTGQVAYDERVSLYVKNEVEYKRDMARRLVSRGIVPNENAAIMAISLAMNIFEMGGVWSLADSARKLSWESDAMRLVQRPETKFVAKIGKEIWGGPWDAFFRARLGNGAPVEATLEEARKWGIIPKLLAGSFLDQETGTTNEGNMSMADALFGGYQIDFGRVEYLTATGETASVVDRNDLYFSWRKDSIKPACDMVGYLLGKVPLEIKVFSEIDNAINRWMPNLVNAIRAMRDKSSVACLSTEMIIGALGGSIGIWPFRDKKSKPYLRISNSSETVMRDYTYYGNSVIDSLGLSRRENEKIKNFFDISFWGARNLHQKVNMYEISIMTK